jgi:hypothetical protein
VAESNFSVSYTQASCGGSNTVYIYIYLFIYLFIYLYLISQHHISFYLLFIYLFVEDGPIRAETCSVIKNWSGVDWLYMCVVVWSLVI